MEIKLKIPFKFRHKEIGFRFDMLTWWKVCDMNGVELSEMADIQEKLGEDMAFASHYSFCINHNKRMKYNRADCRKWTEDMSNKNSKVFVDTMLKSKIFGKSIEEWGEPSKKK